MRRFRFTLLPAFAAATSLVGASLLEPLARGGDSQLPDRLDSSADVARSEELAKAIRSCDLDGANDLLESIGTDAGGYGGTEPHLILGLAAEGCGRYSAGLEDLRAVPDGAAFEDWRLLGVARSAIALGQYSVAESALDTLREEHPSSPLAEQGILAAAQLSRERGDLAAVVDLVHRSRSWSMTSENAETLRVAGWESGVELGDPELRQTAAIDLLVEHPITASKLKVIEEFRAHDGSLDWPSIMTGEQLIRRAERLREVGLLESALSTLEDVPLERRGWDWRLVSADVLTASRRGEDALAILDGASPDSLSEASDLEWRRAFAALEVSRARPGRQLNFQQRQMMRARAHEHLAEVIRLGRHPERSVRALRLQFEDALDSDEFEESLSILRRLKALDPGDTSGASHLWKHGWKQYQQRNHSGAIGYWTELAELYPTSSYNRSGLYWTARAQGILGNRARARALLETVADVPFTDFYRRQALRRLGREATATLDAAPATPTEPWPRDPVFRRAELLTALGLDEAALIEVNALDRSESRPARALRSSILSAAGEWRQSIIEIKGVFPVLGSSYQGMAPDRAQFLYYPLAFDSIIEQNAERNGLDRNLVLAMIRQESAFDARAHSRAGARGLMQVMPSTGREIARRLGLRYSKERLSDPSFSVRLGTTYYKQVRSMFGNDEELALAGYNAGPYRIKRLWRQAGANAEVDRFLETLTLEETKSYVKRVLLFADSYRRLYADAPSKTDNGTRSTAS